MWNEFIATLIAMTKESQFTIPIMLVASRTGLYGMADWGLLPAGIVRSIIPCWAVNLWFQRHDLSGLMTGAVR